MTELLLDMDGPLAAFDEHGWLHVEKNGWQADVASWADQRHRYFTDHLPTSAERKQARRMTEAKGWFRDLPVTAGAKEGVRELLAYRGQFGQSLDIWVCTKPMASNPYCADEKRAWIAEHFPELKNRIIITPDKSMVCGSVLLDDAPNPAWIGNAWWKPVIFTQPFNGEGSHWAEYPHWTWGDDVEVLLNANHP